MDDFISALVVGVVDALVDCFTTLRGLLVMLGVLLGAAGIWWAVAR